MYFVVGDQVKIRAYYMSSGRKNERIEYEGYGEIAEAGEEIQNYIKVNIGVRDVMVKTTDIIEINGRKRYV